MTNERKQLIDRFQRWLDTNPRKEIIASQCANIAEEYAEMKVKKLSLGVVIQQSEQLVCKNCGTIPVRNEGDWCNKCIDEGF